MNSSFPKASCVSVESGTSDLQLNTRWRTWSSAHTLTHTYTCGVLV